MGSRCAILILIKCEYVGNLDPMTMNTLILFNDTESRLIGTSLGLNGDDSDCWPIKILGIPSWSNIACHWTFKYAMEWIVRYSPKYPKIYKCNTSIIKDLFENILDSTKNIERIDDIKKQILSGIDVNISWPPCSVDDQHELVKNQIFPPSSWKDTNKTIAYLMNLKINHKQRKNVNKASSSSSSRRYKGYNPFIDDAKANNQYEQTLEEINKEYQTKQEIERKHIFE